MRVTAAGTGVLMQEFTVQQAAPHHAPPGKTAGENKKAAGFPAADANACGKLRP